MVPYVPAITPPPTYAADLSSIGGNTGNNPFFFIGSKLREFSLSAWQKLPSFSAQAAEIPSQEALLGELLILNDKPNKNHEKIASIWEKLARQLSHSDDEEMLPELFIYLDHPFNAQHAAAKCYHSAAKIVDDMQLNRGKKPPAEVDQRVVDYIEQALKLFEEMAKDGLVGEDLATYYKDLGFLYASYYEIKNKPPKIAQKAREAFEQSATLWRALYLENPDNGLYQILSARDYCKAAAHAPTVGEALKYSEKGATYANQYMRSHPPGENVAKGDVRLRVLAGAINRVHSDLKQVARAKGNYYPTPIILI